MVRRSSSNIAALLDEARRRGGHKTKRETMDAALTEYVRFLKRHDLIKLFGKIEYADDWDPRAIRGKAPIPSAKPGAAKRRKGRA